MAAMVRDRLSTLGTDSTVPRFQDTALLEQTADWEVLGRPLS